MQAAHCNQTLRKPCFIFPFSFFCFAWMSLFSGVLDHASFLHSDGEAGSLDEDLIRTIALAELLDQLYQRQISVQILARLAAVRQRIDVVVAGEKAQDQLFIGEMNT